MSIDTQAGNENGLNFTSLCDPEQAIELEKAAHRWGVNRRIAFVIAAKSRSKLTDVVRNLAADDEDALFEMFDGIRGLIEHYKSSVDLFSAVEARLFVAAHDAFDMPFD